MTKKIFGYISIVLSIFLGLAVLGSLPKNLAEIIKLFHSGFEAFQLGSVIGGMFVTGLFILLVVFLWKWGMKAVK
ncbi:hypothetical protein MH928_08320 [Flavobacterium sp. WW92]|uniref:hypothetical protein n=1 Tax=unclassified Flavobacterium TaxID=196869 RepID=UPI0022245DBB|nr:MULTISPECIES: hypothetical protein [unclassified Flavobacterium]WDO14687.1 hypothetical protein MH928_08320 [Flavobacterium sp. WW92]